MRSVTTPLRKWVDCADSSTPTFAPLASAFFWIAWAVSWKSAPFTGTGKVAGLARILVSMASSLR